MKNFFLFFIFIWLGLSSSSYAEDYLSDYYFAYIFIKKCNDLDSFFYVNEENLQSSKQSIRNIENDYKSKNNNLDTDVEWNKAVKKWEEEFESIFLMFKSLDGYSEDMAGMCKLYLLILNGAGNLLDDGTVEKDF
tara:strand:+ start:64 stop:468 length:405 start_codon:yes stop_codon:yes gene_type:complete